MSLDEEVSRMLGSLLGRQPRFRYWSQGRKRFCYTTEPMQKDGKKQFAAMIYKVTKRTWELKKERRFRRRRSAKNAASKWHETAQRRADKRKETVKVSSPIFQ